MRRGCKEDVNATPIADNRRSVRPASWEETVIASIEQRVRALFDDDAGAATPLYPVGAGRRAEDLASAPASVRAWADAIDFSGAAGAFAFVPAEGGATANAVGAALFGAGEKAPEERLGVLPLSAPAPRSYVLAGGAIDPRRAALEWALGGYRFDRYVEGGRESARLVAEKAAIDHIAPIATGVWFARDLVNTPAGDLGPEALEAAARELAAVHDAAVASTLGDALLDAKYPMIHAVGRAGPQAPRLIDIRWGAPDAPKVTLVGKGVCFDTGGLDIKPPRFMRNMKKDMGGAAAALGLAHMIMARRLNVRLRILVPAVENSVGSDSFRPGDVLPSRAGLTVEIGDTDAEGRLVLADALAEASTEDPALLVDFATLTGAARVALGPEISPFFTGSDALAGEIEAASTAAGDPVWRLPMWDGYASELSSKVASLSNVSSSGYAGSVTAALFLRRFVTNPETWAHFDIFAWNAKARPGRPEGGELQAGRAMFELLERRYGVRD